MKANAIIVAIGNGIVLIISFLIAVVGTVALFNDHLVELLHVPAVSSFHIALIILGVMLFVHSATGMYGVAFDKPRVMTLYIMMSYALLVCQFVSAIGMAVAYRKLPAAASTAWGAASDTTIRYIQETLHCCGFYNRTDRVVLPCVSSTAPGCKDAIFDDMMLMRLGGCFIALVLVEIFAGSVTAIYALKVHSAEIAKAYKKVDDTPPASIYEDSGSETTKFG